MSCTKLFGGALFSAGLALGDSTGSPDGRVTKRGRWMFAATLVATTSLVTAPSLMADIINVPDDFPTIQGAIDASMDGDEIIVAPGEYVESIDFLGKAIILRSSGGRDVTTIDGDGLGPVVTCESGEERGTVLDGFTVLGGYASLGGGMYIFFSSPTVVNCTFQENTAYVEGAGMYVKKGAPWIDACVFQGNEMVAYGNGGGMAIVQTPGGGGGPPIVIRCSFIGNRSLRDGGGIYNENSRPVIVSCAFNDNYSYRDGGAILNGDSTIVGCSFSGNMAACFAGAMMNLGSPYVLNCSFFNNHGDIFNAAIVNYDYFGGTIIANSVLWAGGIGGFSPVTVTYSDVQGGWDGEGNIDSDPLFVDAQNGDFRLAAGSPCIDAGDNNEVPPDEFDLDGDGDTMEPLPFDLDGNPRFVDDPNTKDTGNGRPPIVDMGAYEFQVVSCPWDLNSDDQVGTGDLIVLLGAWGTDPGGPPDFNDDGNVGKNDLIELLGNWGPCP